MTFTLGEEYDESGADLQILVQDEHFLVVNKPAAIAVHQGWSREKHTVLSVLRRQLGEHLSPVHRLDRATSGALLLARDPETVRRLQRQFEDGSVTKNYLMLVRGLAPEFGLIDHPIAKSKQHDNREARTAFRRLGTFERYSLVSAWPLTGRLHQLRRHLKFISHPLIGDTKYGKGEHNRLFRSRFGLDRLALHATHLQFRHPYEASIVDGRAPLPCSLRVFEQIGLAKEIQTVLAAPAWRGELALLPLFTDQTPASGTPQ